MRLDTVFGPDADHRHVRGIAQFGVQLALRALRRSVIRFIFSHPGEDTCLDPISHYVALTTGVAGVQTRQVISGKAHTPTIDATVAAVQFGDNLGPRESLGQQKNQLALQFHAFALGQFIKPSIGVMIVSFQAVQSASHFATFRNRHYSDKFGHVRRDTAINWRIPLAMVYSLETTPIEPS
jgi:hypothetical protein